MSTRIFNTFEYQINEVFRVLTQTWIGRWYKEQVQVW
jgi:hypothetical protein